MQVHMQYGKTGLGVEIPGNNVTVLQPRVVQGLEDEDGAFLDAVRQPINSPPLSELVAPNDTVAVVIADVTRPLPSDRLLPRLLAELDHVPAANFTIIIGNGSHREAKPEEIVGLVGEEVYRNYRVVNSSAYDEARLAAVSELEHGQGLLMLNRQYVEADRRIIIGFIEPHFMAGFSGGYKAVFPGVAGIDAIMDYHRPDVIGHPQSTWGVLDGNPTQEQIRRYGSVLPVDFCINVALNRRREIVRYFCGEVLAAHEQGCGFVKEVAMVPCQERFPVVLTSNSGYPLDQNLYQTVKGMCAAAEIVAEGGIIITTARCDDGLPAHGNFTHLLLTHQSPQAMLETIYKHDAGLLDGWQVQKLAQVQLKASVALYSGLAPEQLRQVQIEPITDLNRFLRRTIDHYGADVRVAVLPEGPQSVPYLAD